MLTGRESLRRLIGKRRRLLPNLPRILSSSPSPSSSSLQKDNNEETLVSAAKSEKLIDEGCSAEKIDVINGNEIDEFVKCPVCGNQIRGDNRSVNSHIDLCLVRGTKRKLSQRTLLQFSFSSNSQSKMRASDRVSVNTDECQIAFDNEPTNSDLQLVCVDNNDGSHAKTQCELGDSHISTPSKPSYLESTTPHNSEVSLDNGFNESGTNDVGDDPPLCHKLESSLDVAGVLSTLSEMALETYIVGRKFGDVSEVKCGEIFSLVRDQDNIKDPNAIKVVSPDPGSQRVLGYLPRELSRHLAPLIDNYQLNFEGVVTSVPRSSTEIVPIEFTCLPTPSCNEATSYDFHTLKSLCENVVHSINSGKKCPPSTTKYQQNFRFMVEEVLRSSAHLLTDAEKTFLESFSSMSDDGQRLFVRLYTRKGPWFRISNLSYPEILDYNDAARELSESSYVLSFGFKNDVDDMDLQEILDILTVGELYEILRIFKKNSKVGTRKKDLIAALTSAYGDGICPSLPNLILDRTGLCIRVSSFAELLLWRIQRLFFLDGEQDLSAFLLVDMGIVKYPEYKCTISNHAIEVAQIIDQSLDEDNSERVLQCIDIVESLLVNYSKKENQCYPPQLTELSAPFLKCFSASWVYSKAALLGVSYYEQERRYKDAIRLLKLLLTIFTSDGRRGYWILRLSIDLEHVGFIEESLSIAEDGVLDPWVRAGSRMALQRRVMRLGKPPRRWKAPSYSASVKRKITEVFVQGRPLNSEVGMKSRFYGEDGEQCGVEELALQFYAGEGGGWQGVHSESGIWLTIYGLLMWDIIFADVPDVFRTRFQNAPLDMDSDNFYVARRSIIEAHLQKIHEGLSETILIMSWESHVGTVCRGVNWEKHSLSELRAAVTCIGGPCLANLCRLLAQDYRSWTSGMPDLLLWRFQGDYNGEAKLVEVKGPRDRLSEQQRAWLLTLMDCGFTVEVCKVSPSASK
ncbi:fanconi-associated nuclease 1 homolog isoform X2 [Silene latifolia]|uniref:fanconi-associated nuclease 1 homolog isoform X2 n=1 Tax=Silene latifolia TaxID=37657 RepID=UPI003D77F8EB